MTNPPKPKSPPNPPPDATVEFPERVWVRRPDGTWVTREWQEGDYERRLGVAEALEGKK